MITTRVQKILKNIPKINQIRSLSNTVEYERMYTSREYPLERCQDILKNDVISVLGYGPQGKAQSLILRDQNYPVILGLREEGKSWDNAISDGWIPNENLFT